MEGYRAYGDHTREECFLRRISKRVQGPNLSRRQASGSRLPGYEIASQSASGTTGPRTVEPWWASSGRWEPTYNASLISPVIKLEGGCRIQRTVRTDILTVCIIGGLIYKETSHKKPKNWKKLSYIIHMGSQEGCHRKVWTNLSISGNPDNSEGVGGDRPGGNQDHRTGQEVLTRVMNSHITGGGGGRGVCL